MATKSLLPTAHDAKVASTIFYLDISMSNKTSNTLSAMLLISDFLTIILINIDMVGARNTNDRHDFPYTYIIVHFKQTGSERILFDRSRIPWTACEKEVATVTAIIVMHK